MTTKNFTLEQWIKALRSAGKFCKLADMMKMSGHSCTACRRAASRLVSKGLLIRAGKELYGNTFAGFSVEEAVCQAYLPSYLSCEYALSRHGVIDGQPLTVTAVTLKRGKHCMIGKSEVVYEHIRKNLFWGFAEENGAFIAEPEKAMLDWICLKNIKPRDLDEVNWDVLQLDKLKEYAKKFPPRVRKILRPFFCLTTSPKFSI